MLEKEETKMGRIYVLGYIAGTVDALATKNPPDEVLLGELEIAALKFLKENPKTHTTAATSAVEAAMFKRQMIDKAALRRNLDIRINRLVDAAIKAKE